jgi:hypothetical protein
MVCVSKLLRLFVEYQESRGRLVSGAHLAKEQLSREKVLDEQRAGSQPASAGSGLRSFSKVAGRP